MNEHRPRDLQKYTRHDPFPNIAFDDAESEPIRLETLVGLAFLAGAVVFLCLEVLAYFRSMT